jgi:predicted outer membrane repeat protein
VIDSNFTDNNATRGGAIYNTGTGAYNFTVLNSTFTINNANLGGAIYNNNGDTSTVVNSTFINNKATASNGGAIYNGGAYFTVDNSTFKSNKANNGGAIYNTAFDFTVNNSNFTGNEATVNGGAIYNSATANIRAYDNNMVDNVAGDSGNDIYDLGTISIGNSIINVPDELIVGKKVTITGVLIDWKGNPVDGAELNVIIDDVSYKVITNPDGTWALTYPLDTGGNFTIAVILTNNNSNNNNLYANFRNSTELFVSKISTNSTINAPNTKAKQNTTIVGVVTDGSGNFLANLKITLNINGVNYIVTTNSNGVWSSPQALNVSGNFSVVVTWEGNTTYDGFVNSTYWAVNKLNADSTIVVTNATVGKSTNINGVAKDENGDVLTGITLTVTIAGENRTVITNSNGSWNLSYTPTTEGNFNVVVTWAGNIINNGFNVSNMIKVAKANVSMTPTPTPTNIKISAQSTKKIKTNVYSKSISFKNYGQKTGSKKFTISINKKYKITRVVKSKNISYNYNKKTNKLTVNVKNLAHSKVSKIQYKIAKK